MDKPLGFKGGRPTTDDVTVDTAPHLGFSLLSGRLRLAASTVAMNINAAYLKAAGRWRLINQDAFGRTTAVPGQVALSLVNDGDAMVISWPPYLGAAEYVVARAAAETDRMYIPINTKKLIGATSYRDNTVYDGVTVYYKVFAVVGGVEKEIGAISGTQAARTWVDAATLGTYPSGTYENLNIRMDKWVGGNTGAFKFASGATIVLKNSRIASVQHAVHGYYGHITVENVRMWSLYPGGDDRNHGKAINGESAKNLTVKHCLMDGFLTTEMKNYNGNFTVNNTFIAVANIVRNVQGRRTSSTTADGYQDYTAANGDDRTFYRAQAFLFNDIQNVPGVNMSWNWIINEPGFSRVEDNINTFRSSGTPTSHIKITNNYVNGAYAAFPWDPRSTYYTGGGIITGDQLSAYCDIDDNIVVACSGYHIGLVGGNGSSARNNKMVHSAHSFNGKRITATNNNGIQFWDYNKAGPTVFRDNTVTGNLLAVQVAGANNVVYDKNSYTPATSMAGANNVYSGNTNYKTIPQIVTYADEYATYAEFREKVTAQDITVGPY